MNKEQNNKIILCMVINRPSICKLSKNICCAYCDYLEDCVELFRTRNKSTNNNIKPCTVEDAIDCENQELIE